MNNKGKKVIIGLVFLLILLIIGLALYFGSKGEEEQKPIDKPDETVTINTNIERLNSDLIFDINHSINEYLVPDETTVEKTVVIDKVYYNPRSAVTYYFITGYSITTKRHQANLSYQDRVNYLLLEKKKEYELKELDNSLDISEIISNYDIVDVNINSNIDFLESELTERNKLSTYIKNFKNLLIVNPERAYKMLGDTTKEKYPSYEIFYNHKDTINNFLGTNIYSYSIDDKTYMVKLKDGKRIDIIENYIMDYQIEF